MSGGPWSRPGAPTAAELVARARRHVGDPNNAPNAPPEPPPRPVAPPPREVPTARCPDCSTVLETTRNGRDVEVLPKHTNPRCRRCRLFVEAYPHKPIPLCDACKCSSSSRPVHPHDRSMVVLGHPGGTS